MGDYDDGGEEEDVLPQDSDDDFTVHFAHTGRRDGEYRCNSVTLLLILSYLNQYNGCVEQHPYHD